MATREQIESLKIDENVFELVEDTELEYLIHFAAPYTGGDKCVVPKGTAFAPHGPMSGDALYIHLVEDKNDDLIERMRSQVKINNEREPAPPWSAPPRSPSAATTPAGCWTRRNCPSR